METRNTNFWHRILTIVAIMLFVETAEAINLQSWDDQIPNPSFRFFVLSEFDGLAVLDRETQLVWERTPPTGLVTWSNAISRCFNLSLGGRKGYRLPTIEELTTLVDTEAGTPAALPVGNPFGNVQVSAPYWSATTEPGNPNLAWVAVFGEGGAVAGGIKEADSTREADLFNVWCVRGGHGHDAY
jgi:hypothetical protein